MFIELEEIGTWQSRQVVECASIGRHCACSKPSESCQKMRRLLQGFIVISLRNQGINQGEVRARDLVYGFENQKRAGMRLLLEQSRQDAVWQSELTGIHAVTELRSSHSSRATRPKDFAAIHSSVLYPRCRSINQDRI